MFVKEHQKQSEDTFGQLKYNLDKLFFNCYTLLHRSNKVYRTGGTQITHFHEIYTRSFSLMDWNYSCIPRLEGILFTRSQATMILVKQDTNVSSER